MPWKVVKRSCKQKSTNKSGSHVVVKVKKDGGTEQSSCHTSKEKADGAVRARYANEVDNNEEVLLREYIRALLTEAAKGPADLPQNVLVAIKQQGDGIKFQYMIEKEGPYGTTKLERATPDNSGVLGKVALMKPDHPCGDAWEVVMSGAKQGWGPMLYDVAMEWATQNGGGLVSDRSHVSPSARGVWDYYLSNRGDVQGVQLDDLSNTITPEEEDNCEQHSSKVGRSSAGMPKVVDFQESPLSKRYTKPPTTMNALEAAGKLVMI